MKDKNNHSLTNPLTENAKAKDTQIKGVSERDFNLVYYFILGNPKRLLDIATSTGVPLETVFKSIQHLREKQLLGFCCRAICKTTKTESYKYYIDPRKEGDNE